MTDLLPSTLAEENQNLQSIANELAARPDIEHWAATNADISNHVGAIHQLYPWLPPGVTLALGTARYTADDPFVKQIADTIMQAGRKADPSFGGTGPNMGIANPMAQVAAQDEGTKLLGGAQVDTNAGAQFTNPITRAIHHVATDVGSVIPGSLRSSVKMDVRDVMAGLNAPLQTVSALGREAQGIPGGQILTSGVAGAFEGGGNTMSHHTSWGGILPQITLVQMLNGKNAGSGFFPGGEANKAATAAQTEAASITGPNGQRQAWTFGRGVAGRVFPANSGAYRITSGLGDAAVALYADPAQLALNKLGDLREAGAFRLGGGGAVAAADTQWGHAGGIFDQLRQTIGIRTATEQLNSAAGQGIIHRLTTMDNFRDVHHFLGGKPDAAISAALADAHTPEAVRAILDHELGTGIETLPSFHPHLQALTASTATDDFGNLLDSGKGSLPYSIDRTTRDWRPLASLPGGQIPTDLSKPWTRNQAVATAEAHMVNAHVNPSDINDVLTEFATASNKNQMYAATTHMLDVEARTLVEQYGLPAAEARKLTRAFTTGNEISDTATYFSTSLTNKYVIPGVMVDGEPMILGGPHLPTEHLGNNIPLPDFREIRRAASDYRQFIRSVPGGTGVLKGVDHTVGVMDALMHTWKAAQLLRPALTARLLGESQLAMAASGDASAFRHVTDYLAYTIGRKGAADIAGETLDPSDFADVFRNGAQDVIGFDAKRMVGSQATQLSHGEPGFMTAWAQELRHLTIDPISRAAAQAMTENDIATLKDRFFSGNLRSMRVDLMENGDTWRDPAVLGTRAGSDAYIDSVVERIRDRTRDDPELLSAVAGNSFRGEQLAAMKDNKQLIGKARYERAPQSLSDRLDELDASGTAPAAIRGNLYGRSALSPGAEIQHLARNGVKHIFNGLIGTPNKVLAVSPFYRQEYYKEVTKLLPFMDRGEAEKLVAGAEAAGIHGLDASRAVGSLDAGLADRIAKSRALATLPSILHDLGNRSQMSDILRFVFPFGDAYKKVLTRWAKLVAERPATVERFRQGMTEATSSGFAHTDPQTGQVVFTIPFSQQIDHAITGLPFPMQAPLNGLSVVGSGLPGVGPAISVPMGLLAPHVPVVADVMSKIVPYGPPNVKQGILEAFLPGWAQRLRTSGILPGIGASPDQQSTFAHTVDDVLRYYASTNQADFSTPNGIAAAVAKARHAATLLYVVRGAMQAVSPSAPSPDILVKDKSGRMTAMYQLTNELQNLYNGKGVDGKSKNDPAQAQQIFLKLHGGANYLLLQADTTPRRYGLPTTAGAASWLVAHPGFQKQYPNVFGLLTPQKGAFDYTLYQGQIHNGQRVDRTSEDFLQLANARIASMIYDAQRNALPDNANSADKTAYLGRLRQWLEQKYPGYQAQELKIEKASVPMAIAELGRAASDPAVANSAAAQATREYLAIRQQVIDFEKANGSKVTANALSTSHNFDAQHEWLDAQASALISRYPTFFPVWDSLLSFEVTLPATAQAPVPTPVGG